VGTGINSAPGFAEAAAAEIAKLTKLPFCDCAEQIYGARGSRRARATVGGRYALSRVLVQGWRTTFALCHADHGQGLQN